MFAFDGQRLARRADFDALGAAGRECAAVARK